MELARAEDVGGGLAFEASREESVEVGELFRADAVACEVLCAGEAGGGAGEQFRFQQGVLDTRPC